VLLAIAAPAASAHCRKGEDAAPLVEAAAGIWHNLASHAGQPLPGPAHAAEPLLDRLCQLLDRPGNPLDSDMSDEDGGWSEARAHEWFAPLAGLLAQAGATTPLLFTHLQLHRVRCTALAAAGGAGPQAEERLSGALTLLGLLECMAAQPFAAALRALAQRHAVVGLRARAGERGRQYAVMAQAVARLGLSGSDGSA